LHKLVTDQLHKLELAWYNEQYVLIIIGRGMHNVKSYPHKIILCA